MAPAARPEFLMKIRRFMNWVVLVWQTLSVKFLLQLVINKLPKEHYAKIQLNYFQASHGYQLFVTDYL